MKESNKLIAAMLVGAAVGGAVAWFLTSENKDEMLSDLKDTAEKVKKDIGEVIDKSRDIVEELTGKKANEPHSNV